MSVETVARGERGGAQRIASLVYPALLRYPRREARASGVVAVPIYSLNQTDRLRLAAASLSAEAGVVSRIDAGLGVRVTSLPRWRYEGVENPVTLGEIFDALRTFINGEALKLEDVKEVTTLRNGRTPLKLSSQLAYAVNSASKFAVFKRQDGGVDVFARIVSQRDSAHRYSVLLSVRRAGGKPVVAYKCSCPIGDSDKPLFCKHAVALLAQVSPHVFAAVDSILSGKNYDSALLLWMKNYSQALEKIKALAGAGKRGAEENFLYYIAKFLLRSKDVEVYKLDMDSGDVEEAVNMVLEQPERAVKAGILSVEEGGGGVAGQVAVGNVEELEYPEWAGRAREKLWSLYRDIASRFGVSESEWAFFLVYSLVAGSDPSEPPVTLHAVGDIGTFKTLGAKIMSEYVLVPLLEVEASNVDGVAMYSRLLGVLEKYLGVPKSSFEMETGGLVDSAEIRRNYVKARLSLPHIASILRRMVDGGESPEVAAGVLASMISELRGAGFNVSTTATRYRYFILDPAATSNIDDYRYNYVQTARGWMREARVFSNHVLLVDEGSRNPDGLEVLLTKMSLGGVKDSTRILVITDNLEPLLRLMGDKRYDPLHDRVYRVMTQALRDEIRVHENLGRPPVTVLSQLELMSVWRLVKQVPIPEALFFEVKMAFNMLAYSYRIVVGVDNSRLLFPTIGESSSRTARLLGENVRFVAGGRFTTHAVNMARFHAFMNGRPRVMGDDVEWALRVAASSRMMIQQAADYVDYKMVLTEELDKLSRKIRDTGVVVTGARLLYLLHTGHWEEAQAVMDSMLEKVADGRPEYGASLLTALEVALAVYGIDFSEAPRNIRLQAAALALVKGDATLIERFKNEIMWIRKLLEELE